MKKYILMLFVLATTIISCTNDDITISYSTNFKINPHPVIEPFVVAEQVKGELESINSNYQLRVRLLIYNDEGILVSEDTQTFSNYAVTMSASEILPEGNYLAIAISDIIKKDGSVTFWDLSNYNTLSTATISNTNWIGDYGREILGVAKQSFSVREYSDDVLIDIEPAGSIFKIYYFGVRKYSDVVHYQLSVSKNIVDCKFNNIGEFTTSWETCDFENSETRINMHTIEGSTGNNYYHYAYVLPTSNLRMRFDAYLTNKEFFRMTDDFTVSPQVGEAYLCGLFLDNNEYIPATLISNTRSSIDEKAKLSFDGSTLLLKNIQ